MNRKLMLAVSCIAMFAMSANAGVCKIGNTEYDSLQEALDYVGTGYSSQKITLLQDIDVTELITIPRLYKFRCTIDGDGHAIRQAYKGRMFKMGGDFTYVTFTNVTILGGGEEFSTAGMNLQGVFMYLNGRTQGELVIDSGCVISNFVSGGSLIGAPDAIGNYSQCDILINPGSVIAYNSSTNSGCIVCSYRWLGSTGLKISGGEIFGNRSPDGVVANITAAVRGSSRPRTDEYPIIEITGGSMHDNVATSFSPTSSSAENPYIGLFFLGEGPMNVVVSGGEIFDNEGSVFGTRRADIKFHFAGGKIFGNTGYAAYDYNASSEHLPMLLRGDAIVAGNWNDGKHGLYSRTGNYTVKAALDGDFSGFARFYGGSSLPNMTNLVDCVGLGNVHGSSVNEVYVMDATTQLASLRAPNSAKIGTAEYATFAAALSAAADGDTIVLMRDCIIEASIVPPANKAITVNGAGYRIFRGGKAGLIDATAAGGNMTFTNVELNEGYFVSRDSYTNHVDGAIVNTRDGVAATVTLGTGTILSGGRGTNALVRVANGATVNLDGCVITGAVNRAVAASAGGTLGVKGATIVKNNAGGDIDVANGNILSLNGDLTGGVHVTVAGVEACEGQRFGTRTGSWTGAENFINGGSDPKLRVSESGALVWYRRGFVITFW